MRRIKVSQCWMGHGGVQSSKPLAGESGKTRMAVLHEGDYRKLLAVARAAEALDRNPVDSALETALWIALDKLNKERK